MFYKADTPLSRTQNMCFLISISAVILKLIVKITSIFFSYRLLRIAWPDIFSLSDHFPTPNPRLLRVFFVFLCFFVFFYVMATWLQVMFDVDVAHLGHRVPTQSVCVADSYCPRRQPGIARVYTYKESQNVRK